jgi:hypothetical protein
MKVLYENNLQYIKNVYNFIKYDTIKRKEQYRRTTDGQIDKTQQSNRSLRTLNGSYENKG